MTQLVKYEAARKALAEAKNFDEVKQVDLKAEILRAYARQAGDRQLEIDAAEIRIRARRRIGEMLIALKSINGFNKGGRQAGPGQPKKIDSSIRLDELGIDRKLSSEAQTLGRLDCEDFETQVTKWRAEVAFTQRRIAVRLPEMRVRPAQPGHRLLDGTTLARVLVGRLPEMIAARRAELRLLQTVLSHCGVSDNLKTVDELVNAPMLARFVEESRGLLS